MTRESREGLKIVALLAAIALLWLAALTAIFWIGGKMDDGGAKAPSDWKGR